MTSSLFCDVKKRKESCEEISIKCFSLDMIYNNSQTLLEYFTNVETLSQVRALKFVHVQPVIETRRGDLRSSEF